MSENLLELQSAKADDVNFEIARQWGLLLADEDTRALARERDVDLKAIDGLGESSPISAEPKEEGNQADVLTAILIKVGGTVATAIVMEALKKAWKVMIEPQIKSRFSSTQKPPQSGN